MHSKTLLRLIILAIFLTIAIGYWSRRPPRAQPEISQLQSGASNSASLPVESTAQLRPEWKGFSKRQRTSASPAAPAQPLFVEWHGRWYPAERLSSVGNSNLI